MLSLHPPFHIQLFAIFTHALITTTFVQATITIPGNYAKYKSLPASFGMVFGKGREYLAKLQSLMEADPYLCDLNHIAEHSDGIVVPKDGLPVAILAQKGQCTFEDKARLAQKIHPVIKYLVICGENPDDSDLIKMTTQNASGIKLGILYVNYASGQDLLMHISKEMGDDGNITGDGTVVNMDSYTPWSDITFIIWVFLVLTFGTLAFGMISIFLCLNSRLVLILPEGPVPATTSERDADELLTIEEVQKLPEVVYRNDDEEKPFKESIQSASLSSESGGECGTIFDHYSSCSICLEDFDSGEKLLLLPKCQHYFHSECIIPWLTERHPTCPLCKANVKEDLQQDEEDPSDARSCTRRTNHLEEVEGQADTEAQFNDHYDDTASQSSDTLEAPLLENQQEVI